MVIELKSEAVKERHWKQLMKRLHVKVRYGRNYLKCLTQCQLVCLVGVVRIDIGPHLGY